MSSLFKLYYRFVNELDMSVLKITQLILTASCLYTVKFNVITYVYLGV